MSSLSIVASYLSVRIVAFVVLSALFALLFAKVLTKRKPAVRWAAAAAFAAFVLVTAFVPVENLLVRFPTAEASVKYSLPNEKFYYTAEQGGWGVVLLDDKQNTVLQRDAGGWKVSLPALNEGFERKTYNNLVVKRKKLSDGVWFVSLDYRKYADPKNNEGRIMVQTVEDSLGSAFSTTSRPIMKGGELIYDEIYFWTFADAEAQHYRLIVNGEEITPE